jgi:hypothetical protein
MTLEIRDIARELLRAAFVSCRRAAAGKLRFQGTVTFEDEAEKGIDCRARKRDSPSPQNNNHAVQSKEITNLRSPEMHREVGFGLTQPDAGSR